MKIALAQLNVHVGNFEQNFEKITNAIQYAKAQQADLVLFPELAICGYPPQDLLEYDHFINQCEHYLEKLVPMSNGIAIIIGAPTKNKNKPGKKLYNSACFIHDGKIKQIVNKTLLPNYDIFDEARYFETNKIFELVPFKNKKIALTICEDIWTQSNSYQLDPVKELVKLNPDFIINISASPFDYLHFQERINVLKKHALDTKLPIVYVNTVGANTSIVFDGRSLIMNQKGEVVEQLKSFDEAIKVFDLNEMDKAKVVLKEYNKTEEIYHALILGIKDYFKKSGFSKAILGLSGGIDSAVVMVLAIEALGKENVWPILMPSQYTSEASVNDAEKLIEYYNLKGNNISIQKIVDQFDKELAFLFKNTTVGLAEENIQSRVRGNILMALSNKFGHILLNTSNKSELATGYGTLYGDMAGGLSILGDVYKTEIYELAKYINRKEEIIPNHILTKAPSAELRPDQKDSDTLPEYEILDNILFQYIEQKKDLKSITSNGPNENMVEKVIRLVNLNEYKRRQFMPVIRVSPKAFGIGRRMPVVAKF